MQLNEKDRETKRWLEIAKTDLGAGKSLAGNTEDYSSQSAFFAQQAAEKTIKGFLVWHQERFKKDHDIRYLGDLALKYDLSLKKVIEEATSLNPFAVTFRYPGEPEELSAEDVEEALKIAETLFNEILARLPKDVHP